MPSVRRRILTVIAAAAALAALLVPATIASADEAGTRIVGGNPATDGEYPWAVALHSAGVSPVYGHFCGGSLVAANAVLTAAHCVVTGGGSTTPASSLQVSLDMVDLNTPGETLNVQQVTVHPDYLPLQNTPDIAILHLASDSAITPVQMASSADSAFYEPGDIATVMGWGATSQGGFGSDVLLEVDVPIVSDDDCNAANLLYGGIVAGDEICAGDLENGGIDSCQGDSGGPMIVNDTTNDLQVGVVSWGIGCAQIGFPGVYAEVPTYKTWIEDTILNPPEPEPLSIDVTVTGGLQYSAGGEATDGAVAITATPFGSIRGVLAYGNVDNNNGGTGYVNIRISGLAGLPIFFGSIVVNDAFEGHSTRTPVFFGSVAADGNGARGSASWFKFQGASLKTYRVSWSVSPGT